ncbi:MAG: hypothetical protein VX311_01170, partial [Planctomycetota bacterium]|nr:hypothetical protein [Planctomycetota bacterium]
ALSAGLVLLYIPRTRHALTFLSVGFLVAMLSLWLAEPITLLLQPAGLGLALAALAAFLHHRFGQRPSIDLVSLTANNRLQGSSGEISLDKAKESQEPSTALHSSPTSTPVNNPEVPFQLDSGAEE